MGRTNGRLVNYLTDGLVRNLYPNLKYEQDSPIWYVDLPRYDKSKRMHLYEGVLKDWYKVNGNEKKYISYSKAKAVFKAGLKKSVYVITEPKNGSKYRFHFASPQEIEDKRRKLQEKELKNRKKYLGYDSSSDTSEHAFETSSEVNNLENEFPNIDHLEIGDPPSVKSSSSGYITGEEVEEAPSGFNQQNGDAMVSCGNMESTLDFQDMMKFLDTLKMDKQDFDFANIQDDDLFNPIQDDQLDSVNNLVQEMEVTPVDVSEFVRKKTYWLCNKKLNLDSTLLLICEKQPLEEGSQIAEGTTVIPNGVWESGNSYDLKKSFELDEKLFLFLSRQF